MRLERTRTVILAQRERETLHCATHVCVRHVDMKAHLQEQARAQSDVKTQKTAACSATNVKQDVRKGLVDDTKVHLTVYIPFDGRYTKDP